MRVRKFSAVALVAMAAGLSLTACNGNGTDSAATQPSSAGATAGQTGSSANGSTNASANGSANGSGGSGSSTGGTDAGSSTGATRSAGSMCRTANLSFTVSHGMAEGELVVNLTNTGPTACTMHGFPGVDLKGKDGTVSAARSKLAAPDVTVRPGQQTRFTLHYPPNTSGGSGTTFTTLIVTPPNETHSHAVPQTLTLPVTADPTPSVTVDPVGVGK